MRPPTHRSTSTPTPPSRGSGPTVPPPDSSSLTVRLYPALYYAARSRKLGAECDTWMMLRALDTQGGGWIERDAAIAGLTKIFGLGRSVAYARLASEKGRLFWRPSSESARQRYFLTGLEKVVLALDLERLTRCSIVPAAQFQGVSARRKASFKAYLAARSHQGRTNPTAQATIRAQTGLAASTQRRYRDREIVVERNLVILTHGDTPAIEKARGIWRGSDGRPRAWIAHSYAVPEVTLGGRWTPRKVNKKLSSRGDGQFDVDPTRRYFRSKRSADAKHGREDYLFLSAAPERADCQVWIACSPDMDRYLAAGSPVRQWDPLF